MKHFAIICIFLLTAWLSTAQEQKFTALPAPQTDGGMPLMKALKNRQTSREYSDRKLTDQQLANLLWAANGINRTDTKKRTAPSAMNYQENDIYVFTSEGWYLYDANRNGLVQLSAEDLRAKTGTQDFVKTAPVDLVFVADYDKMTRSDDRAKEMYAMADAAYISENVYLFCASEGLATGVRASVDKDMLGKAMNLRPSQHIMLGQSVGYPKQK
ncbi:MAG TPA: SagB/ThcOx family dehydrogenase [Bacteroidales bacterium]|nr:SagB/ThcOx family dehydrogenase [Bacteroidales bacterium]